MKHFTKALMAMVLLSCCGTKKVVKNIAEVDTAQVVTPQIPKTPTNSIVEAPPIATSNTVVEETRVAVAAVIANETIIANQDAFNHIFWDNLLQKYVSDQGNVNYKGFKNERKALTNYISSLGKNMPNDAWKTEDKLAYWINAYNAMTVDLILRNYPIKSIKDINKPWEQRLWKLGDQWYNLDEIEHKILRKMNEPRIHFGIVCASFSCPKLQNEAFTSSKLEAQLTKATKEFLSDTQRNSISENELKLSKIFKWFSTDFNTNSSLIAFLNKYSDIQISSKAKTSYKDYNWTLNE